jgi:hypothetical protein
LLDLNDTLEEFRSSGKEEYENLLTNVYEALIDQD